MHTICGIKRIFYLSIKSWRRPSLKVLAMVVKCGKCPFSESPSAVYRMQFLCRQQHSLLGMPVGMTNFSMSHPLQVLNVALNACDENTLWIGMARTAMSALTETHVTGCNFHIYCTVFTLPLSYLADVPWTNAKKKERDSLIWDWGLNVAPSNRRTTQWTAAVTDSNIDLFYNQSNGECLRVSRDTITRGRCGFMTA